MAERVPLLVVGAGPAGMAASLQARRDGLDHLVVGREPAGGLLPAASLVENLPGWPGGVAGEALARRMARQAAKLGLPVARDEVVSLERAGKGFLARLASGRSIESVAVVLATGTVPRPWGVAGADAAAAAGLLHRDVRTLPRRLAGGLVAIVGGGDAALDSALTVVARGGSALILVRASSPAAAPRLIERCLAAGVRIRTGIAMGEIETSARGLRLSPPGESADHLIACIGRVPDDSLIRPMGLEAVGISGPATPIPGLFLSGDLVAGRDRYAAPAMGSGASAAIAALAWIST